MLASLRPRRRAALLLTAVLFATACLETPVGHEADVAYMRITLDATTVTVNASGEITGGPLTLYSPVATPVSVEFLDAEMNDALADHPDEYQLNVTTPVGVTFTRTGPYAGTLLAGTGGDYTLQFALFHLEEGHEDFGPFDVPITAVSIVPWRAP